ncbi:DUF308 domain-containing protein [Vagococcus luciliae]|uniref:DUF308 domain-containing protein n=1 Tax=Vagococcus luciliae TaxID=2920380 RepID=A0ABY5P060_9ENTE|nr:DUF308 domain-containing protein [Vagococcus luciliae]UUV99051.1 hypothetical protein G314FT_12100 [Vagococcus luciliae]
MKQFSNTLLKYAKKIEWHSFLMGGLMMIFGFIMVFHLDSQIKQFSIIMGLVAILKGFLNFNYYSTNIRLEPKETWHIIYLISGIVSVIVGLSIIFNFSATNNALCVICGLWFIWDYIPQIILSELEFINESQLLITFRIIQGISILCGVILIFQSFIPFINPLMFAIVYYFLSGGILLWENYQIIKKRS